MMRFITLFFIISAGAIIVCAQSATNGSNTKIETFAAEKEYSRLAVEAHGGDKLKKMRSLAMSGSVDVTASTFPQPIPATFIMIFAGNRYRVEINNPFQPLRQAYDGTQTVTSISNGFTLPPFNRVGFPVLQRVGEPGFIITSIPENKKKGKSFRVTTPEGYVTDFYLDEKSNQVKSYNSVYDMNGRFVKTAVEIDRTKLVDGVLLPDKYVQRFDLEQFTVFAAFTAKQLQVNTEVTDDVFTKVN